MGFVPVSAMAQQEDEQDQEQDAPQQLPEIAPREIEIRGELQLSFPSLERQPLRGFATPTTIPAVPEGRMPYAESYKQALDDLPESLPAPSTASTTVSSPAPPKQGFVEIGGGRYVSRFAKGLVSLPLTDQQRLSIQGNYTGTNGFSPFSGSDVETPSDAADAQVRFESRHDGLTVAATVHGASDQYTLYGLPAVTLNPAASAPDRMGVSGGLGLQFHTHGSVESNAQLSYDVARYETQLDPTDAASTAAFSQGRFKFNGTATFSVAGTDAHLDLLGSRSSFGGDVPFSSGYNVAGGAALQLLDSDRLAVRAGGRFLSFETPVDPTNASAPLASASFITPLVRIEAPLTSGLTAYARNTPRLRGGSLSTLYAENPYAAHAPSVRPTLFTTDAETGLRLTAGAIRLRANAGYRYAPSYQYFSTPTGAAAANASFPVGYDSARILHGGAELALQGLSGIEAVAGISVRDGVLIGDDDAIPYFSPVAADAMLSVSFADQRGLLQTTGTVESPRPVDRAASAEVRTYVSFDVEGSYEITPLLDVVVRFQNLAPRAPKRWARYPRPPASMMGGFRMHW